METYLLIGAASVVVGLLGSIAGFGGGVFLVPLLTLAFGYPIRQAIGSTMLGLVPGMLIATLGYLRAGVLDGWIGGVLLTPRFATTYLGAYLTTVLSGVVLEPFFAGLLMLLGLHLLRRPGGQRTWLGRALELAQRLPPRRRRTIADADGGTVTYEVSLTVVAALGALTGVAAGLFGIGGGFITTPVLILGFSLPVRVAVSTSLLVGALTAVIGAVSHYRLGNILFPEALTIGAGLAVGGLFGPRISFIVSERAVAVLLGVLLTCLGVVMFVAATREWF